MTACSRQCCRAGYQAGWWSWRRSWGTLLAILLLSLSLFPSSPDAAAADRRGAWPPLQALLVQPALAGPVDWQEVPAGPEGRQWWDAGSLRRDRNGTLSVLSRFQPAPEAGAADPDPALKAGAAASDPAIEASTGPPAPAARADASSPLAQRPQPLGTLYVMQLDCDQELYRDVSVNGLPRWRAPWQAAAGDSLTTATLRAACAAAPPPRG